MVDSIFENMTQKEYDQLCENAETKSRLDAESERIGKARINEAMADEWLTIDEFSQYMEEEIRKMYEK